MLFRWRRKVDEVLHKSGDYEQVGKEFKRSQIQKNNWRKYRLNYERGIKKYHKDRERNGSYDRIPDYNKRVKKIIKNKKKEKMEESNMLRQFNKLFEEIEFVNTNTQSPTEGSDEFNIKDLDVKKQVVDQSFLDDLDITNEMLNTEVYFLDNLGDFNIDYTYSEKNVDEEKDIEEYYFDIVQKNHKVLTVLIHKIKKEHPIAEMVVVSEEGKIKNIKLSDIFLDKDGSLNLSKPQNIPLNTIREYMKSLSKYPEHFGFRLNPEEKEFYKKDLKNFKNITNDQKKAVVDSLYFEEEEKE